MPSIDIPDVSGSLRFEAEAALHRHGLIARHAAGEGGEAGAWDKIVGSLPAAGTTVKIGSMVDLLSYAQMKEDSSFEALIFRQELNEVYLLLDFISGQPSQHMSDLENCIFDPNDGKTLLSANAVVQRVSSLRYPPQQNDEIKGLSAAFLLMLKDKLNSIAYPAKGQTIAYTILFSEGGSRGNPSRLKAAELAFPGLVKNAAQFRILKTALAWVGVCLTILSALCLWEVTYGAQLATRFEQAKSEDALSEAKVYNQLDREQRSGAPNYAPDLQKICEISLALRSKDVYDSGRGPKAFVVERNLTNNVFIYNSGTDISSTTRQICDEYAYKHALFCVSISDINEYAQSIIFKTTKIILPVHEIKPAAGCENSTGSDEERQEDAPSVGVVLAMMSNYILPMLFGLVGTLAALVRGIQDKITASLLSPRDRALSLIRLPLGMVAGVSVGLFLSPANVSAQTSSNIGAFTISASGLAFLAGYGAEGFFRALDALLAHIFSTEKSDPPANRTVRP